MKKSIAFILIIFSLFVGMIVGSAIEKQALKKSIRITNVVENYDKGIGTVTIDWGSQELDDGSVSDKEEQDYNYILRRN